MSDRSEMPSEDSPKEQPKRKAGGPKQPCIVCGKQVQRPGGYCMGCYNRVLKEKEGEFKAELEKGEVPADLMCMRWVQTNVGLDVPGAATDKRKYYKELFERSVKEFHAAAEKAEAEFAASKQVAAGPKARADEGLDRCIQIARDWLRDNAPGGS